MAIRMLRPDAKGRITLGHLADGISGFKVTQDEENRIILEPYVEIAAREQWLFQNKKALEQVKQGLQDAAEGRVSSRGSFAHYTDDDAK